MTSSALLEQCPTLRPEITVTSARYRGPSPVFLVSDARTGRSYEFGPREHFVVTRLSGHESLHDIGVAYARQFGRQLSSASWLQLLGLLFARDLLVPAPGAPTTTPAPRPPLDPRGSELRLGRWVVASTSRALQTAHRRSRWVFGPLVQVPAGIAIAAVLAVVLTHAGDGLRHLHLLSHPVAAVVTIVVLWASLSLHEVAHGVAACHFGGDAPEIGVLFRPPMVFLYCRVDGAALVTNRRARIIVAAAGVWMNLLVLVPVLLWWTATSGELHDTLTAGLFVGALTGLVNLVPIKPLDGYAIAGEAFRTLDLAAGSSRCVHDTWSRLRGDPAPSYPSVLRAGYLGYAAVRVLVLAGVVAAAVWYCVAVLPRPWGQLTLACLLAALLAGAAGRIVRRESTAPVEESGAVT